MVKKVGTSLSNGNSDTDPMDAGLSSRTQNTEGPQEPEVAEQPSASQDQATRAGFRAIDLGVEVLAEIVESSLDSITVADRQARHVYANPAACELLGYSAQELVGRDTIFHNTGAERERMESLYAQGWSGRGSSIIVRPSGEERQIDFSAVWIEAQGRTYTVGITRDMTETRRLEREGQALMQIASSVAYGGSLKATLDDICEHVVNAASAVASAVLLFGPHDPHGPQGAELDRAQEAHIAGAHGLPEDSVAAVNRTLAAGADMESVQALLRREVTVVPRMSPRFHELVAKYPDYQIVLDFVLTEPFDYFVAVPMVYGDNLVGGLFVYYPRGSQIDDALLAFQAAIADQTAVAVQNARLLSQVQEKTALEQRQHLARELHDSVTQSLFSINLTSRTIEMMMEREGNQSAEITKKIGSLRQLTQGALAEMRALIFELRPGALEEEGLVQAIRKHAAAIQSRNMLLIEVAAEDETLPRLKPDVEEALYRITQEALHNIVKHAGAGRVQITLQPQDGMLLLQVTDDGVGFEVEKVPAGHMGLRTMGQRAAALNADYRVASAPGMGTTISVRLPLA
jgi:PAS domain S-box-containing protein